MRNGKLRVGLIGAGGIAAKLHLPGLLAQGDRCEVALISGRKESRLRTLQERFGVPRYTQRFEDVLADDSIDAIVVATPHPLHVRWGIEAIRAGKHVFVEKPLCADLAEADAFVEAAERTDRTVFCMPHFDDAFHTVKRQMAGGAIGKISGGRARTSHGGPEIYYREVAEFFGEPEARDLWFFDVKRAGGVGALFDMGVYAVAHMVAMLGTVRRVAGVTATFEKPTELEDTAALALHFAGGAVATAETSWCDPGRTWAFAVHGTAGKFEFGEEDGRIVARRFTPTAYDRDEAPVDVSVVDPAVKVGSAHANWLDCIEKGVQPPLSNAHAARHVTEVLLAGLEAGRSGRAVVVTSQVEPPAC
jgi:predicted dehydrogenase